MQKLMRSKFSVHIMICEIDFLEWLRQSWTDPDEILHKDVGSDETLPTLGNLISARPRYTVGKMEEENGLFVSSTMPLLRSFPADD